MSDVTSIPNAIDALYNGLTVRLGTVQVLDGPPAVSLENVGVAVGYTPDDIAVRSEQSGAGLRSDVEDYGVNCIAWVRDGDGVMKVARDNLFGLMNEINKYLTDDPRLGGVVTNARLRIVDYDQLQTSEGCWATVAFVVTCKAFR